MNLAKKRVEKEKKKVFNTAAKQFLFPFSEKNRKQKAGGKEKKKKIEIEGEERPIS